MFATTLYAREPQQAPRSPLGNGQRGTSHLYRGRTCRDQYIISQNGYYSSNMIRNIFWAKRLEKIKEKEEKHRKKTKKNL